MVSVLLGVVGLIVNFGGNMLIVVGLMGGLFGGMIVGIGGFVV